MGQLILDPKTGKYVDAYDLKKAKDTGSMSREAYNAALTYKAPNPALTGTTVNRSGQRVNETGQVLGATERRQSLAPNNTITRFQNEPDYYAGNEALRQRVKDIEEQTPDGMTYLEFVQGGGKVNSTYAGGQSVRDNAQQLATATPSGGETELADMMRAIKEQQKKLGQTIKSEGTANNMNAAGQGASFGVEDDAGSLVDAVTAERNDFFKVDKQRDLLKKQLGLQKEEGEDARNQLIRERDQQIQELQQQQATAKRDATNLYFGGQDAPMNTTVAGIGESRAAEYDKLIRNVQDASADQLRQLDRDIRSGNLEAEALMMDFDLQERTAIVNEVQRRLNTRSQSAIAQIEYLKEAGALTETAPEVLKSIAQAGGINYGTLLALQAVEKQAESIGMASYADLSARMQTGEVTAEEAKQFYELDKLQSEAMKLRRELEPVDNVVNGVNFTKLTEAADLAKKLKESGASAETINTVLQASGASIAAGADIDFERVEKVIATARMMNDYLSPDDVKGFLDSSLQVLGFNADVMITQDPMLGLKMQEQEINNLLKQRELNGYLTPIEQAQLEGLMIDNETKWQELSGGGGGGMSGGGSGNWQVIPGSGKTRADRNNNPGNLRAGGNTDSGGFTIFATAQEGFQAMINDVTAKLTGNSPAVRSKLGRNAQTLRDVISVYAPKEDNNNPNNYANVVAKQLGISPDAPVGSLLNRVPELAAAMAKHEGYSGSFQFGGGATEKDAVLAQIQSGRITPGEISDVRKQADKQGWLSEFTRAITEPKNQIISPKTAETFKTDIAMTGRQLDRLVQEREQMGFGNSTFQRLPQEEYDKLRSLIASGSRAQDALALYDKLAARSVGGATGQNMALFRAGQNRFGKQTEESQMYNELARLVGVELSEYIKNISGAAVSESEAQRLKKNVPNLDMPDSTFRKALQDFIAQKNTIAEAKARSFGFRNANEFSSRLSNLNFPTQPTGVAEDTELLEGIMNDPSENLGFDIKGIVSNVFNAFRR